MPQHSLMAIAERCATACTKRSIVGVKGTTLLVAAAIALAVVFSAVAQTGAATDNAAPADSATPAAPIQEIVVVTAPRLDIPIEKNPAATTVVTPEELRKMESKTIAADEALRLVPGVKVDNQADGERVHISIRGQGILTERGIRGIKVLLDGIPLNDPMGFAPDLFDVNWATVRRVEVLRGPSSALYGCGGSGGVINIVTKDGGPESVAGDAFLTLGSHHFGKVFGEAGGVSGATTWEVSASRYQDDGYRVHTASDATNLYGKLHWTPSGPVRLTAIVSGVGYFNENAEGLNADQVSEDPQQPNPDALKYNEYQKTRRMTLGLTGQAALGRDQDLDFGVYYRRTIYLESVPSSLIHRTYDTPGALLQYKLRSGAGTIKNEFSAGTDLGWQKLDEFLHPNLGGANEGPELLSDETIRQWGVGVYAMDRVELGKGWGVLAGVRWDRVEGKLEDHLAEPGAESSDDKSFQKTTGRVGVTWSPVPKQVLYASWGQGFLPPATEELANNPAGFGGFNQDLEPATSQGLEIGTRGTLPGHVTYDVAIFHLNTDNDFGRYRIPERPLETFYRNVGSTRRNGLETSLAWYPVREFEAQLAYTFSDFKYEDVKSGSGELSGTWLPNAPRHQAYVDLEYRPARHWMVGASVETQSRSYTDETNEAWAGGYTLYHLRAGWRWEARTVQGEVSVAVRNAGDKQYIAFTEPDPDGNSYQPGAGREYFVMARFWLGAHPKS